MRLAALVLLALAIGLLFVTPLDPPQERMQRPGTVILDSNGAVIHRDIKRGLRIPISLDHIAPVAVEATIATEDQRFWSHPGVDPIAIGRALLRWQEGPSGASTITQQLARRLYLRDSTQTVVLRKAHEALLALRLERQLSKRDILALYLNEVYYGRGAYGLEAAARAYFSTSARDLDLAQAALLVGLPQLPAVYDPVGDLAAAKGRQAYVLDRMVADGYISPTQAAEAWDEPLDFAPAAGPDIARHFTDYVLAELERVRPDLRGATGLVVDTTLDAGLQTQTEHIVRLRLEELHDQEAGNAALVALDPNTGHVLAMVGSADFFDEGNGGQINMALQPRQPGSALKPFLYAAALEHGFTAATPLLDVPTTFSVESGIYTPVNYDRLFHGVVPLRVALASSFNVPAVRTLDQIGMESFLEMAHRVGLRTLTAPEAYGLALTLGGGAVRLLDITAAYGTFATGGQLREPMVISRVHDATGRLVYEAPPATVRRVISAEHAFLLADILSDAEARAPGFGLVNPLNISVRAGVKTGTTTGPRDNWTIGFTPDRVVGVWLGNTDNRPMGDVSGVDGAGPIWRDVMQVALKGLAHRWPEKPTGLVEQRVCSPTGLLPGPHCPTVVEELFVAGTTPTKMENYYVMDGRSTLVVNPPVEVRAWSRDAGISLLETQNASPREGVHVVQPSPGSVFFLAPELARQELVLRAAAPGGTTEVEFLVDGLSVGRRAATDPWMVWHLAPGLHELEVVAFLPDGTAARGRSTYEVRAR